ncbi:polysaccharide deacetylase [Campylobacter iguaniorum]|uniref:polysaccharide deacetylase family protein n=1 Tax=Campylobacter iguaniorum TaxID=1244531 RepID=UPI00073A3FC2|nr:polysaccharide deacetylase family protein [Campylobacter iguaniorum]ALV25163.1 polysaccharide deacetylase [Campylobacter iguaniorum]
MTYLLLLTTSIAFLWFSLRYNWWRVPQSYAKARVLMYHSISEHFGERHDKWRVKPSDFEEQISWLHKNGFQSFTISELANLKAIPNKSVAITFDDGYGDNYDAAFKILKKYNFKATIYLVPNQRSNHWEKQNTNHLANMLNAEQIQKMQSSNLIEFGSHTLGHVNLATINANELQNELQTSKKDVENITQTPCTAFAYPYGKYNENIKNAVINAGYKNAVIVKRGLYTPNDDKFEIKRIGVLGTESFFDFYLKFTRIRNKL